MNSEIIIYQTEDNLTKIEVALENETVWLTQAQLGELFQKSKSTISEHIKNVFEEGELDQNSTVRNFRTTAANEIAEKEYGKYKERQRLIESEESLKELENDIKLLKGKK